MDWHLRVDYQCYECFLIVWASSKRGLLLDLVRGLVVNKNSINRNYWVTNAPILTV